MKVVFFDIIGTTVRERDPNTISDCLYEAFLQHHIQVHRQQINDNRGRDKKEMIEDIKTAYHADHVSSSEIYHAFQKKVEERLDNFETQEGFLEIMDILESRHMALALGTGLSRDLFESIVTYLQWPMEKFSYVGFPGPGLRGRPHPDMIYDLMSKMGLSDPKTILKVGDTVADIREGKNAGVVTAALLAGTQPDTLLKNEKPDHAIRSLRDLVALLP